MGDQSVNPPGRSFDFAGAEVLRVLRHATAARSHREPLQEPGLILIRTGSDCSQPEACPDAALWLHLSAGDVRLWSNGDGVEELPAIGVPEDPALPLVSVPVLWIIPVSMFELTHAQHTVRITIGEHGVRVLRSGGPPTMDALLGVDMYSDGQVGQVARHPGGKGYAIARRLDAPFLEVIKAVAEGAASLVDPLVPEVPGAGTNPLFVRRALHLCRAALRAPAERQTAQQDQAIIEQIRLCRAWLQERGEPEDGPLDWEPDQNSRSSHGTANVADTVI